MNKQVDEEMLRMRWSTIFKRLSTEQNGNESNTRKGWKSLFSWCGAG
jgi:hypothetical protein